ncbi:MAG: serine/threonine protein kinase [Sandaracinaceae bacterium]|nr:serine/threonine protein kinase [Sandaracinaceae bacterium]
MTSGGTDAVAVGELQTVWAERGIVATELAVDRKGTIVQVARPHETTVSWSAVVSALPEATAEGGPLVVLGAELGRGGMGVVRSATQRSLGREVAVKTSLEHAGASATQALLREAWISGQLEHPNVVPVYALYRGDDAPLMVMRRVEGREWSLTQQSGETLEHHLRVLTQVCHAVQFAHTRGLVHLDLKPSNVMLGSYGEIYLLDWGIAVCVREDLPEFLPRARDIAAVLGTPAYMAPELAAGNGAAIDARTDVYLLGAMLHEILTGEPPHVGPTLLASLTSAFLSEPHAYPATVPPELAAIATRALSRDPDDRYGSAAELREAVEDYLVHADSLSLAAAAQQRIDQIDAKIGAEGDDADLDQLAAEAEFGFRQALHVWPGNEAARVALQALIERLVRRDLAKQRWQLAQRRLADLPEPRPELDREVERLRVASAKTAFELERLRHDADLGTATDQRSAMAYLGAFLWCAALVGLGQLDHWGVVAATHWHMLAVTGGGTVIFAAMVYRYREALFVNAINRNAVALLSVGWILGDLYWVGAWAVQTPFEAAVIGVFPVCVFVIAGHAASVDRRLVPHTVVAIVGNLILFVFPAWGLEGLGITGGVVLVMLGRTWRRLPREAED